MYLLYSALLAAGLLFSLPYWMLTRRHGKYREGLGERLGKVPPRLQPQPAPAIWVHAVSVGEVLAVSALVKELRRNFPQYRVVVSTTTATGQKLAKQHFGEDSVFHFPLDFRFAIQPYFAALRPRLIVLAETEFWPNFLQHGACQRPGCCSECAHFRPLLAGIPALPAHPEESPAKR